MKISLIAAVSENGVIGNDGKIPWRLPNDFKYFKEKTLNHHVIMGKKTWQSIGKPLPNRTNIVVSSANELHCNHPKYHGGENVLVVKSIVDALKIAEENSDDEAFIIGGSRMYAESLRYADNVYLTLVHAFFNGDTFFPFFSDRLWHVKDRRTYLHDASNEFDHSFIHYQRHRGYSI